LLASSGGHPITDEAAFLCIEALRALGRTDDALEALATFPARHPGSYLIERTVFLTGDLYEHDLMEAEAAQMAYTDLLTRFPGSLLAPEARQRLRRLRGDRPPG
jgi:cellulose synthase operon protein C